MTRKRLKAHTAPALVLALLAGVAVGYGLPGAAGPGSGDLGMRLADAGQSGGHSVHMKNRDTPDWMLELQTRQAQQAPLAIDDREPSFWI